MENNKSYADFVSNLVKGDEAILRSLQPGDCNLIHMTLGVAGEAGEILDAVKKYTMYRKPLDMANLVEELGDIEFYLEGLRQQIKVTREEVLAQNIEKLSTRYGAKYSDKAAIERKDKQA